MTICNKNTKYVSIHIHAHPSAWAIGMGGEHFMGLDDDCLTKYHCFNFRIYLFIFIYLTIKVGHRPLNLH